MHPSPGRLPTSCQRSPRTDATRRNDLSAANAENAIPAARRNKTQPDAENLKELENRRAQAHIESHPLRWL